MRPIKQVIFFLLIAGLIQCAPPGGDENSVDYPQPLPDSVALPFLPGIVSTDSLDFNAAFSPDGRSFFFSRSPKGKYEIYISTFDGTTWTEPTPAPFSEDEYSEADPFVTPDGTLYYISNRPRNTFDTIPDFDIWFVRSLGNGKWSAPENLEVVNSDSTEYYVSLSANGNLYFASNRPGGLGSHDIYVSKFIDGNYTTPQNIGPPVNSPDMDHDPLISKDEQLLIFTSVGRKDGYGEGDLYYSQMSVDKKWSLARNMGSRFNTLTYEYCAYLSPDSRYFFFSSDYDVKWIKASYLPIGND